MTRPREAQLELLLTISEGLSRGSDEMLRVSPTDAMHAPSCGLAIRDAVEELKWMRAEIERLRGEMQSAKADAWDDGYEDHRQMIEGIARKPSNPYR